MQHHVLRVAQCNLLDLVLLNEATPVLVDHREDRLDVISGFASRADLSEEIFVVEIFVVEMFGSCGKTEKGSFRTHTYREALALIVSCYSNSLTISTVSIYLYLHE